MRIWEDTVESPLPPIEENNAGRFITVLLMPFPDSPLRNFRCTNCGKLLFQYMAEIEKIVDSPDVPARSGHSEHFCQRCHLTYKVLW